LISPLVCDDAKFAARITKSEKKRERERERERERFQKPEWTILIGENTNAISNIKLKTSIETCFEIDRKSCKYAEISSMEIKA